jgi:hypothetical protein
MDSLGQIFGQHVDRVCGQLVGIFVGHLRDDF